jgi:rhodanese-related sulfurtransferase
MASAARMLLILAAAAAGAVGSARHFQMPWIADREKLTAQQSCAEEARATAGIDTAALQAHYSAGFLVIDARPEEEFLKGHLAAPMILNLPPADAVSRISELSGFEAEPIVIYCTSLKCHLGEELYCILASYGFINLKLYLPGWDDGIVKEKLPVATGPGIDLTGGDDPMDNPGDADGDADSDGSTETPGDGGGE